MVVNKVHARIQLGMPNAHQYLLNWDYSVRQKQQFQKQLFVFKSNLLKNIADAESFEAYM